MRLIDADALIANINKSIFDADDKEWYLTLLANAPSIDLVRCGECKHWRNIVPTRCTKHFGILVNADDFCSYGERKESE